MKHKRGLRPAALLTAILLLLLPVTVFADVVEPWIPPETQQGEPQEVQAILTGAHADVTDVLPAVIPPKASVPTWALLDLVLAVLTVAAAVAMALGLVAPGDSVRHSGVLRTLALVPAVLSAASFLMTQNVAHTMTLTDRWTYLLAALALVQALLTALFVRKTRAAE